MYTNLNLNFFASDASWPGTSTFNWNFSRFQDMIRWIDAAYGVYLPGSCGVLLKCFVNRGQESLREREFRRGSGMFTFSAGSGWLSAAQWMTPVIFLRINLKPGGHKNLITIRPVCFQERNHFIFVCKIYLDEFTIGSWVCQAFDIVVVLLEGLEYYRA